MTLMILFAAASAGGGGSGASTDKGVTPFHHLFSNMPTWQELEGLRLPPRERKRPWQT